MEESDLNEEGARKKAISSVKNARKKLSEETARVVKLVVKQNATYRELQEKHAELEGNHERLQQNMAQLQMDYANLSTKYQEELRRRPEVLNLLMGNRKINAVLQDNMNRVRESLKRSAADATVLAEAYAQASEKVTALRAEYVSQINAANNATQSAQNLVKLKDEQCTRLSQCLELFSSHAEKSNAEFHHMRGEQRDCLKDLCAQYQAQVEEKNKSIQDLRDEIKRASSEFDERMERQRKIAADLEREAGAATVLREVVTQAESRCEMLNTEGKRLATELLAANTCIAQKQNQNQKLQSRFEEAQRNLNFMVSKIEQVIKELNTKTQKLQSLEDSLEESKKDTIAANEQVLRLTNELECKRREFEERITTANNELERQRKEHEQELSSCLNRIEVDFAREKNDFNVKIQSYEDNLNKCNEIITSLKLENEHITDTRDKSLATINELKSKVELEVAEKGERILDLERRLTEKLEIITNLQNELTINKELISQTNNTIQELKAESQRKLNHFEEHRAALEIKIAESDNDKVQLRQDLAEQSNKLAQAEEALNASYAELNTARADAAHAMDHVRRLEATVRDKDDKLSKQMKIILAARAEYEPLNDKIRTNQETFNDIAAISESVHREPPEHDHNSMFGPPTPRKQMRPMTPSPCRHQAPPAPLDRKDLFYNRDTDNSVDGLYLNHALSELDIQTLDRNKRKQPAAPVIEPVQARAELQSQVPAEAKPRKFFKTTRLERETTRAAPVTEPVQARAELQSQVPAEAKPRKFFKTTRLERETTRAAPVTEPVQARAELQSQVPAEAKPRKFFKTRRLERH